MGSGITAPGIRDHKPRDRDQWCCKEIRDAVFRHNNKGMGSGITAPGIRDHKPWDRDQWYCNEIRDPVFPQTPQNPEKRHANLRKFSCIIAVTFRSGT